MPANSRWDLIRGLNNLNDPVLNVLRITVSTQVRRRRTSETTGKAF